MFEKIILIFFLSMITNVHSEVLSIGAEDDAAPWSYKDGTGFANDVVREAFKAVGVTTKFDVYPYARCKFQAEKGGRVACFTTSKTPKTEVDLLFPKNSLINVRNVLYVRKKDGIKNCDIKKWPRPLTVIFTNEYEYVDKFNKLIENGTISAIKVNTESQSLTMLQRKRAEAAIINVDEVKTIKYVLAQAQIKADVSIGCDLGVMPGYLAFSRKNPKGMEAMAKFDKGFEMIKKNGVLKKLQLLWAKKALQNI